MAKIPLLSNFQCVDAYKTKLTCTGQNRNGLTATRTTTSINLYCARKVLTKSNQVQILWGLKHLKCPISLGFHLKNENTYWTTSEYKTISTILDRPNIISEGKQLQGKYNALSHVNTSDFPLLSTYKLIQRWTINSSTLPTLPI